MLTLDRLRYPLCFRLTFTCLSICPSARIPGEHREDTSWNGGGSACAKCGLDF
jgi:hypothetical protein